MFFHLTKPPMPILFPNPNEGGLTTIIPFCGPNRWSTATSCTLEIFTLKSIMSDTDFSTLQSDAYPTNMNRAKFTAFCKSLSIDILDSAKVSYRIKHI